MVPLPLQFQFILREIVAIHESLAIVAQHRLLHLGRNISLLIGQHRPSVLPGTWLQREHSAHTTTVLEYDAIPVAILIIYNRTLSYAIESGKLRFQNHLLFVRALNVICTITNLTTRMSLWPRNHQEIILAVVLDHAGAFEQTRFISITLKEFTMAARHHFRQVGIQQHHLSRSINHVCFIVVIEEESGIMEMLQTAVDSPFAFDIIGCTDISLSTGIIIRSKERIELATMILQRSSPLTTTIHRTLLHVILRRIGKFREDIVHGFPVHQILRFHDRRTRHQMHGGAHHIEAVAHTDYIHIRHISPNHRIGEILLKLPPVEIEEFASLQSLEHEVYIMLSCHFL